MQSGGPAGGVRSRWGRIPLLSQLQSEETRDVKGDLTAGITVGVMLIPQGMAYALIAGVPPVFGLYAALAPLVVYALLGSSRQLAVGPVAMVSLLVAAGVAPLAGGDPERYLMLAVALAALVGVIQLAMGFLKLGFLVNFLSHPVLSGFTAAAALIIAASQLPNMLGVSIPRGERPYEAALEAARALPHANGFTVVLAFAGIVAFLALRRWLPRAPAPMLVVVFGTGATWLSGLPDLGVQIVGTVPSGLPSFEIPVISLADMGALTVIAVTIALVGFMESIAVAKTYASKRGFEIDANQELKALGAANLFGSVFQSFPVTGGFSRTAVNDQAGAKSQLSSLVSVGVIAVTLVALTPLFYYLPKAALAAIIIVAVSSLVDLRGAMDLWRIDRRDFGLMVATFGATLALGIEVGILVGAGLSVVRVIDQISRPYTARLGRVPGTNDFRDIDRHPEARPEKGVVVVRMEASLFYGNAGYFRDQVRGALNRMPGAQAIVIDTYPINRIDSTGIHMLNQLINELERRRIRVFLSGVKGGLRDGLERGGIVKTLGPGRIFGEINQAVEATKEPITPESLGAPGPRSQHQATLPVA